MTFVKNIDKIADYIDRPVWIVSWILLAGITMLSFVIVMMRYAFDVGYIWLDEICRYSFACIVYLWAGPIIRKNGHLQLDFILKRLPVRWQYLHSAVVNFGQLLVAFLFVYWGSTLIGLSKMLDETTESFVFKVWWLHTIVAVSMGLIGLYSGLHTVQSLSMFFQNDRGTGVKGEL